MSTDTDKKTAAAVVRASELKGTVHPDADGFVTRVTPKEPKEEDGIFFWKCPKCDSAHFRHAGYVTSLSPFIRPGDEKRVGRDNLMVMVCCKCRKCYCWINEQMYDVTDKIDLKAWEKAEKELHESTGPGGQC